jgi:hypothetical protein
MPVHVAFSNDADELASRLAQALRLAKQRNGSNYVVWQSHGSDGA